MGRETLPSRHVAKTMANSLETNPILEDPLVNAWWQKQIRKKDHQGIAIARPMLNMLERLFNTCRINPSELIQSKEAAEKFRDAFMDAYKNDTD